MAKIKSFETTLDSILENSMQLYLEFGFENVTFAQVAKKVGISQPALYAHVDNKMDLLRLAVIYSIKVARDFIDSRLDPKKRALDRLKQYLEGNIIFFYEQKKYAHSILALYYFASSSDELYLIYKNLRESAVQRINIFIIQAQHENLIKAGCEEELAASLHTILVGFCFQSIYAQTKAEHKAVLLMAEKTLDRNIELFKK